MSLRTVFAFAAGAVLTVAGTLAAEAADAPYRERAYVYERPVPRVYYQTARPTAVCRVVYSRDHSKGWPKEQDRVARCTRFD